MTPTTVAVLLLLALVIDYMSVGPDSIRDRIAFLMGVAVFREGFDDSPLDDWTVDRLSELVDQLLSMTGGAYIAGAVTATVVGAGVGILAIYTVGCLLPVKASKRLGRFATLTFPASAPKRINMKLWVCAILLGMLADLPHGVVGQLLVAGIDLLVRLFNPLPAWLFGAA